MTLEPATDGPLVCSLSSVKLADAPSYEALSYVWGHASRRTCLECDGNLLSIPTNLATALYRLRCTTTVRLVWADAICINQEDIRERNQQVAMMGSIYRNAHRVIAWLGSDSGGHAKLAFDLFQEMLLLHHHLCLTFPLKYEHPIFKAPEREASWHAFRHFVENPYFERGWIQQEIGLAKHVVIYWGNFEIPWDVICKTLHVFVLQHALIVTARLRISINSIIRTCNLYMTEERFQRITSCDFVLDEAPWPVSFWRVLYSTRHLQFSERHDVVYAFLGHPTACPRESKSPLIAIDYSMHILEMYKLISIKGLVELKDPFVLSLVAYNTDPLERRLPSWVYDFSQRIDITSIGMETGYAYKTGTGQEMAASFSTCNNLLFVRGICFDHAVECRSVPFPDGWYREQVAGALGFIRSNNKGSLYGGQGSELLASLVLVCGLIGVTGRTWADDDTEQHLADFYAYCAQNVRKVYTVLPDPAFGEISKQDLTKKGDPLLFGMNLELAQYRRVFRTQNGYFGLGPPAMRSGDSVCVLFGFTTPFILRRVDDHYILIGECYVHGIMHGEVLEQWRNGEFEEMGFEIH